TQIPPDTDGNHHVALIQLDRSSELPFKIPQLRNLFEKIGMNLSQTNSQTGFGFSHDGSVDTLVRFIQDGFGITNDQTTADLSAFLLSLTGSDLEAGSLSDSNRAPGVVSLDTAAAVGRQLTISQSGAIPLLNSMIALANSP